MDVVYIIQVQLSHLQIQAVNEFISHVMLVNSPVSHVAVSAPQTHWSLDSPTSSVLCVVPPVRQVDLCSACNHQLQLPGIKHWHQSHIHHLTNTHTCKLMSTWINNRRSFIIYHSPPTYVSSKTTVTEDLYCGDTQRDRWQGDNHCWWKVSISLLTVN